MKIYYEESEIKPWYSSLDIKKWKVPNITVIQKKLVLHSNS